MSKINKNFNRSSYTFYKCLNIYFLNDYYISIVIELKREGKKGYKTCSLNIFVESFLIIYVKKVKLTNP